MASQHSNIEQRRRPSPWSQPFEVRFWAKVEKRGPNECWPWRAKRQMRGGDYGHFESKLAHRIAFELHYGIAPGNKCVCHSCDNPPCCNPAHLWLGTRKENMDDMRRKGREPAIQRRHRSGPPEHCRKCGHRRTDDYVFRQYGKECRRCRACLDRRRGGSSAA